MSKFSYEWPAAPHTVVQSVGQASREALDTLASRVLSTSLAEYLAHALAISANAEAVVVHTDEAGVTWTFTARPGDAFPQSAQPAPAARSTVSAAPTPVLRLVCLSH
jgi:hypothetical protein